MISSPVALCRRTGWRLRHHEREAGRHRRKVFCVIARLPFQAVFFSTCGAKLIAKPVFAGGARSCSSKSASSHWLHCRFCAVRHFGAWPPGAGALRHGPLRGADHGRLRDQVRLLWWAIPRAAIPSPDKLIRFACSQAANGRATTSLSCRANRAKPSPSLIRYCPCEWQGACLCVMCRARRSMKSGCST